ncbi:putative disease resistance protein RGA3 [Ananas comosus]|uniref:Putative disease resistance protein RGA3 n=1 Tax=Ananas comosus TaxID=4615 RepID=A0A199V3A2_ANACO|nr:putative disease resistance protein RGA3 [Ananas comosus]
MGSVADMAAKVLKCKRESLNLNELEESDCMSLFNKHAFLAKKLGGCPLAIKVMGGKLNSCMDYEYWKKILEEDIMKLQQGKDDIMTVLRLSYDHLPTYLPLCFRSCSIFLQDYMFKRKELVYMWIGSGLIPQSICGRQRPEDIGKDKLPFIHKLKKFIVREERGYKIGELQNLRDLRYLCIRKLENVRTSEEAMEAKLNEKEYLKSLSLEWFEDRSNSAEADEQLLDNLCPYINLKKMRIEQYQGAKSPCWMTNLSLVNLTSIELSDCKGWEHLPPLGLHAIKQIDCSFIRSSSGCAFPSLKELLLCDMPNLEEWIGVDDGCMFPQLHYMDITECPNLREIPTLPYGLRDLYISNQQEHFQALESLVIEQCEKLEYVQAEFFQKFNTLNLLCIEKCPQLTKRGISDIQLPSILNHLTIGSCGDLELIALTSFPPAQVCARWTILSYLEIRNCKELSSFGGIQALVSLRSLEIRGRDKLIEVALLLQPSFPNDVGQKKNAADCFLKNGELSIDHHALLLMEPLRSLSSISGFTFSDASHLTSLPEEWLLQNCAALKFLRLWNAILIRSLPDLPTSLRTLHIYGCHPVLKERCQENTGLDWPKIAHIPNLKIG